MKSVTVLCVESDRDAALEYLRELGVLHVQPVRPPEAPDVDAARREMDALDRALAALPRRPTAAPSGRSPLDVVHDMWRILHERGEIAAEADALRHERQRIAPFGDFDPAAAKPLAARGVFVRLYQASPRERLRVPDGAVLSELGRTKHAVFYALVHRGAAPELPAQEVRWPERALSALDARLAELDCRAAALSEETARYAGDRPAVARLAAEAEDRLRIAEARAGMGGAAGRIVYLRGFCPADDVGCLRDAAARSGWGLLVEDPADGDPVPTLIRNPAWIRPIQGVFDMIGILPGYREVDVSLCFLLFFSLFFAMLVGDAGYGVLFLALTLWARRRFRGAPAHIFHLLLLTSATTIAWGVLTGVYFGLPATPGPLRRFRLDWLGGPQAEDHIKALCFWLGAIQLSIAHLWNIARAPRSPQSLAQVGWLCVVWSMFFAARNVVLGQPFPPVAGYLLGGGSVLIALFMTPVASFKGEWFNHVLLPLNLVSSFVDVVSYIRLYAVGSTGYAIASTFNGMLAPMFGTAWSALVAALLLFVVHAVNIALSVMGVMVHGIRLNTLEFGGHLGLQWSGMPYRPFRRRTGAATT